MLHLPDAAVVVVAVGADGGVGGAVGGAAGVVVDDGLIAEIDDVERTIGTDAILDGAEWASIKNQLPSSVAPASISSSAGIMTVVTGTLQNNGFLTRKVMGSNLFLN